ncbi:hypothetical protein FOB58_004994 [Candida parapsilosis]|uniref:F-box domain-containing protein n=2 Tax=Candida parapsilosis TaxID=5480 RepID=G8BGV4_CANPC|nr:uncharacterized protein CPAR2_503270 [Candida parapsilosis]KAF6044710.1 hypothetical protein FOB58_004994 [Candida parapsilosis]KAF6044903.1 hypothetical protein FOB59_004380 [Candida parapsilosis]KAF6048950.1 hypothetical protein FOB60_004333 [Candida parapsilosis]KAF6060950.1 hypothetical protein FOB61_004958 [Candida parapsilosis]KAI5902516.1 hypothetical protein K4G60_g1657 [Candida parapsilosis]
MSCLIDLPFGILEEVFRHINQYQALSLAPLHSKLYFIAKPKLYRNIYVREVSAYEGEQYQKFKYHRNLNNLKVNSYTVISSDNFEKYFSQMSVEEKIEHILFKDFDRELSIRTLDYFKSIKLFEIISAFHNDVPADVMTTTQSEFMHLSRFFHDKQTFAAEITSTPCRILELVMSQTSKTSLSIIIFHESGWNCLDHFQFLTSLTIVVEEYSKLSHRLNFKLHKLYIHHIQPEEFHYSVSELFDTSELRELSIVGLIRLFRVFTTHELEKEYPKLVQLCIGQHNERESILELEDYTHKGLSMLVVANKFSDHMLAQMICRLIVNFPKSTINWWYAPRDIVLAYWYRDNPNKYDIPFTHDIIWLSPRLPFGVVGYHFPRTTGQQLRLKRYKVEGKNRVQFFTTLKQIYSEAELNAIYERVSDELT